MQRIEIEEYKKAVKFEKEAVLEAVDRAEKVALAAIIAYSFVENAERMVVSANLFEEGL